jgi:undecaprenyl pyrophosphate phosphatase UppP
MNEPLPIFFYSLAQVLGEILPFPTHSVHEVFQAAFSGHGVSTETLLFGKICVLFAILVRFRHDILSQIVSFIRICIERRRPQAVDETVPLLYLATLIPVLLVSLLLKSDQILQRLNDLGWILHSAGLLFAIGTIWVETRTNHSKTFAYWNGIEASVMGMFCVLSNLPFLTFMTAAFIIGRFRGFRMDALFKYILICSIPLQMAEIFGDWNGKAAFTQGTHPLGLAVAGLTSLGTSWLLLSILTGHRPPLKLTKIGVLNGAISVIALVIWFRAHR